MKDTLALSEPDGTLTHSITCVCRLNTAQTAPLCTWVFNGAGSAMEANDPEWVYFWDESKDDSK